MHLKDRRFFTLNINRMVGHHSGWIPLLKRMRVLAKAPRGNICIGKSRYNVVPFREQLHVKKFVKMAEFAKVLQVLPVPRNLPTWCQA